jgi:sRNA-binding carbon storage regulator CsrA
MTERPDIGNLLLLRKVGTSIRVATPAGDIVFTPVSVKSKTTVAIAIQAPRHFGISRLNSDGEVESKKEKRHGGQTSKTTAGV